MDEEEEDETSFVHIKDTRVDYFSKTNSTKFIVETTKSLIGSKGSGSSNKTEYGPGKKESSCELSQIGS
jgi:hypothetical protein